MTDLVTAPDGTVWAGGTFHSGVAGLHDAKDAGAWVEFQAGSGEYEFRIELKAVAS
jgi:hypothetical protein